MISVFYAVTAVVTGVICGGIFFTGLWLTTQKLATVKLPAIWLLASFIIRMAIVVGGFYIAAQGRWQGMLLCTAGFLAARFIITRFVKKQKLLITEAGHEIKS